MSEAYEQMRVVEWCRTADWQRRQAGLPERGLGLIVHIPNGGWRSKSEAARLKAMGVRAGVADLFLPVMAGGKGGLWIEMKAPGSYGKPSGGRLDAKQVEWLDAMRKAGYGAVVAFGADEAIAAINEFLEG